MRCEMWKKLWKWIKANVLPIAMREAAKKTGKA